MKGNPWKFSGYKPGQTVNCKVMQAEKQGYSVVIIKDNIQAYLVSEEHLTPGQEVLARVARAIGSRIELTPVAAPGKDGKTKSAGASNPDWQQLAVSGKHDYDPRAAAQEQSKQQEQQAARLIVKHNRRAIDLILPPFDGLPRKFDINQIEDLLWLITDLEGGMRTGCVKASCDGKKSRSAVLLYRGRAVGCLYGNIQMQEPFAIEHSLQMMLSDCQSANTQLLLYALPEEITLAMAALFIGHPIERNDDLDGRSYFEYIANWVSQNKQTACLALAGGAAFAFIHQGTFLGSFFVDDQEFSIDISSVYQLLSQGEHVQVAASILPPELTTQNAKIGFSLSMYMPKF